jgi:hypothetical protein
VVNTLNFAIKIQHMKYSLFAFLVLCFSLSFAQLSVQNNAFVFVSDQYIFVTDDVNIDDVDSKIYLRNEGQLLQGDGITGNSGIGELSVYQEGNANQWTYNYWCSPVGNNSVTTGNENARVNLIDDALGLTSSADALFISGYDGVASPLQIAQRWLWTYQTSDQYLDWFFVGSTGDISPGLGFTMKGNGTGQLESQIYDFRGKPNNGTITNDVATGLNTLVGNPYPSAMDSRDFIWDEDNQASITGHLLFWEQNSTVGSHVLQDYQGGYYSFTINEAGTVITDSDAQFLTYDEQNNSFPLPIPTNGNRFSRRYIPIGQGFMVEGIAGTPEEPATVYTKNSFRDFQKKSDGQSVFFRDSDGTNNEIIGIQYQENGLSIVPDDFKRFRINVDFTVDESQYTRQLVLNFHESATAGFDYGLELVRSESTSSDAYFTFDEKTYSAQAYPLQEELSIPLVVDIEQQQPLRFRIFDIQNFEEAQGIFIHDKENDIYVNLRNQFYELNIEPGHYTDRFEIVFTSDVALDVNEFDSNTLTINQINGLHKLLVLNPKNLDISAIEVYSVTGNRLLNGIYDSTLNRYELSTTNLSDGVYVVNIKYNTSAVKSQKIIVKN